MGRASRAKRIRRTPMTAQHVYRRERLFIDQYTHELGVIQNQVWMDIEARICAYMGAAVMGSQFQGMNTQSHPLRFMSGFRFVSFDKRFGEVPVYKVSTKTVTAIMGQNNRVPETEVWIGELDHLHSAVRSDTLAIAWCRKSKVEDIKHAVAWLLMQDKEPVILRAFGLPNE